MHGLTSSRSGRRWLLAILAVALAIRVALVIGVAGLEPKIVDEQHYVTLAESLASGNGFAWEPGVPTSIRPPLYPFFIAGLWTATGTRSLDLVRWAQIPLALVSVILVYAIGLRYFDERSALVAAGALAIYPSLLFSGILILTETLFTTLLLSFVFAFSRLEGTPSPWTGAAAGVALGLAALARSILWPFVAVAAVLAFAVAGPSRRTRMSATLALVLGYAAVVAPWSIRNSSLQGSFTVVDTMGGLNLLMGNYAHTPEDRMWDAVSLTGDQAWYADLPRSAPDGSPWTEGKKEKWAQREALSFMAAHPWTTLRRSLLKFADFWGLERDLLAGIQRGYYQAPTWIAVAGGGGAALAYAATAILAILGLCMAPPRPTQHALLLAIVVFTCAVHSVVFGHSRYHLPLIPLLLLYAGAAVTSGVWRRAFQLRLAPLGAGSLILLLAVIWSREVLVRDGDRIRQLLSGGA
jgi:4-amino-4-deoxy-L-arabinose transferase-like glycosyltransferase